MMRGIHHNLEPQQPPAFFARGHSPFARLVFFAALSLTLMATDSRLQYLASMRENLMVLLHPLQVIANAPSQLYRFTDAYFSTHHHLLNESDQLKKQVLVQNIALQRLNMLSLENATLRDLLQARKELNETATLAEIMHVGRDPFTKKIIVNRGKNHAIVAGSAVVDATGVIGQVTRTYSSTSEVTLITDKTLAIPIQIERNGLRAIAFGRGHDSTLDLPYLPANVDIRRGDRLVTSGIDGIYPAGLAVATVTEIKITPDSPFARIVCVPTGGIENHRQVLLVSNPNTDVIIVNDAGTNKNKEKSPATTQPATGSSAVADPVKASPAQPQIQKNRTTEKNVKKSLPISQSKPNARQ